MPEISEPGPGEEEIEEDEEEDYGYAAATDSEVDESTMGDGDAVTQLLNSGFKFYSDT